jgi:DNA-binding Lrp family transcriptional regulator
MQQLISAYNWCHIADMRIRPDDLVVGYPARQIRKLLRESVQFLSVDDVTKVLGIRGRRALRLLETLEKEGFIEKNTSAPDPNKNWKHTIKGGALSNALFSAPVSRRNAERKLSEFMDRVREINEAGRFLFCVRKVVVFGSFLTESSAIGDLDIAIDLVPKEPDARKHSEQILTHANAAALSGKRFQNFVQRLDFAAQEVRSYLKARSRIIQLTDCDDGVLKIAEHRVIYEYHEDEVSSPAEIERKKRAIREEFF